MKTTNDEINELTDKAFQIIRDGLDSPDEYKRMRTALDFVQILTVTAFSKRLEAIEQWADTISDSRTSKGEI